MVGSSETSYLQVLSTRNGEDGRHDSTTGVTMMQNQEADTLANINVLDANIK